jgi:hypothetical protein
MLFDFFQKLNIILREAIKMDNKESLNLNYIRRFGVELEINSFDGRSRPLGHESGKLPDGIHYVGNLVQEVTKNDVLIHKWSNDHNNRNWIVKPDASCGMEVCTPVMKGWVDLMQLCRVVEAFNNDKKIKVDDRCSLHVHIDVSDLMQRQIASIISWWVKCEPVFMDSVPECRKRNQYCQFLGQTDIFESVEDSLLSDSILINRLGQTKYFTMNTFHYTAEKRKTIEFRIMDAACCKDPYMLKNWIRLLIHFVERAIAKGLPKPYQAGNQWSSYCWLDPYDVFYLLGFMPDQYDLSPGLQQVRRWFVQRLNLQKSSSLKGILSNQGRRISHEQIENLHKQICVEDQISEDIFDKKFRI